MNREQEAPKDSLINNSIPNPINIFPDNSYSKEKDPITYQQAEPLPDNGELSVLKYGNTFYYSITIGKKRVFIEDTQLFESNKWIGKESIPEIEAVLKDFLGDHEAVKSFIKKRFEPNIELLEEKYDPDHPQINLKFERKRISYGNGIYFDLDKKENSIKEIMVTTKGDDIKEVELPFINAYPENGIFQQSPIDSTITYKVDWRLHSRHLIKSEGTGHEIFNILNKNGRIVSTKYGADRKLNYILDNLASEGIFDKNYSIKTPGFHFLDGKIVSVEYQTELPDHEKVKSALHTLEDFGSYFKNDRFDLRDRLSTILKLSLINPFDYIKKGLGYPIEVVFSYGAPATSKTTLTQPVRFVYQIPKDYFMQTGGAGSTEARLSGLMMEATWPRLVDEAEIIFRKPELVALNKQSIDNTYSRRLGNKDNPGLQHDQGAYSTLLYTSNYPPFHHTQDGSVRRYNLIYFDETCKFTDEEKEDFREKWLIDDRGHFQENTPLKDLAPIGKFIAYHITQNPDLLKKNPRDLADLLIRKLYQYAESSEPPLWLLSWCNFETEEDYREMENERIIDFIKSEIEKNHRYKLNITDDEGKRDPIQDNFEVDDIKGAEEHQIRVFQVANNPVLPWLSIQGRVLNQYYILSPGLLDELRKHKDLTLNLKELEHRFNEFEYKTIKMNGKPKKRIISKRNDFEKLLYPQNENEDI